MTLYNVFVVHVLMPCSVNHRIYKTCRNLHYFRLQIFYARNFHVTIILFSSISRVRHIFTMYSTIGK